jgi:plastocyanin
MRFVLSIALATIAAWPAFAADLAVKVTTPAGKPVRDAVVTVHTDAPMSGAYRGDPSRVVQQNLQFDPFVLIVPVGAEVSFPNRDQVRHHVYSFSPANRFELRLYSKDENRTVRFPVAGAVALGCNIHDSMVAFVKVVDTPFAAKTSAAGEAALRNLPAGSATLRVWHPYGKSAGNQIERKIALGRDDAAQTVILDVRTPPERRRAY